jgi:hypothetical protein
MDEPNNPITPLTTRGGETDLRDEVQAARGVLTLLLVATTCMAAALALYLYRQVVNLNRQVVDGRRVTMTFQTNSLPQINWFVANLQAFSKTNPDFTPILGKYNLLPPASPVPGPANGSTPPAASPKK